MTRTVPRRLRSKEVCDIPSQPSEPVQAVRDRLTLTLAPLSVTIGDSAIFRQLPQPGAVILGMRMEFSKDRYHRRHRPTRRRECNRFEISQGT
jgi:hypothetical protein